MRSRWFPSSIGPRLAHHGSRRRRDHPARRRGPQRGQQGRHPGRFPGARARPGPSYSRSPSCSARAWPSPCWARTSSRTSYPTYTGSIGLLGTRPSYEMMMNCDTLLTVGSSFPYTQFLPPPSIRPGRCRSTLTASTSGCGTRIEVNLVGDAAATLRAILPHLRRNERPVLAREASSPMWLVGGRSWRPKPWWRPIRSTRCGYSMSCRRGCRTNAIVTADSGLSALTGTRGELKFQR